MFRCAPLLCLLAGAAGESAPPVARDWEMQETPPEIELVVHPVAYPQHLAPDVQELYEMVIGHDDNHEGTCGPPTMDRSHCIRDRRAKARAGARILSR